MGIKIDLLTGLAIVVIIGVLATSKFVPSRTGGDKDYVPGAQIKAVMYQVALKQERLPR